MQCQIETDGLGGHLGDCETPAHFSSAGRVSPGVRDLTPPQRPQL